MENLDAAGRIGNVTVLATGEDLTSVEVRTKHGRVVATLEVYGDGDEVYASSGRGDRLSVRGEARREWRPGFPAVAASR